MVSLILSPKQFHPVFLRRPIVRDFFRVVLLLHLILAIGTEGLYSAQKGPEKSTQVTLGNVSGPPKTQVMVPLYFTPASEDLRVGSISAAISFDSKMLSFVRAENGFLLEGADGVFHAEVKPGAEGSKRSLLLLEIETGGEPRKSLNEGLVLTLEFEIAPQAPVGSKLNLDFEKLSAADLSTPPKVIGPLSGQSGIIEILIPEGLPYVPCFFFSH